MGNWQKSNQSPRRRFRPKPKWRNPGKAWVPRTIRQERRLRPQRALSIRGEWKYSQERTEEREKQVKQSVKTVFRLNDWLNKAWGWVQVKLFRVKEFRPERIDPDKYITEVGECGKD